ncbi:MAG: glycosyltransferase [Bacteriovoracaceae bacterium]|nr:glycosyltransferase [Bacteriovoracaceae bacterium]
MEKKEKHKIVAIVQIYNELQTGLLPTFFENLEKLVDTIIVYDDGSTDGSWEFSLKKTSHVIRSTKNNFKSEVSHKKKMLDYATKLGADFILSLDADEVLVLSKSELDQLCKEIIAEDIEGMKFDFVNLWRSTNFRRVDSLFNEYKPVKLWRHNKELEPFPFDANTLHQTLHPAYVTKIKERFDIKLLHLGFSRKDLILRKFFTYRKAGQKNFLLNRFIDESQLQLEMVDYDRDLVKIEQNPTCPEKLSISDYFSDSLAIQSQVNKPKISIICLVFKDTQWLDFAYQQVLKYTDLTDKEFYFIANDATEEVKNHLRSHYIPHYVFENTEKHRQEHYINNVYRAYNYGVKKAKGDFVILINSDMAFTPNWVENLYQSYDGSSCVASRLVEAGKIPTGKYGIEKNFGHDFSNYREEEFLSYASILSSKDDQLGGLYMPLLVRKDVFEKVGCYPEGNIVEGSDIFFPIISKPGEKLISGDTAFVAKLESIGVKHKTCFSSVVYHFQEGEKRSEERGLKIQEAHTPRVAVCNDIVTGTMGEKVLWDQLLELPNTIGVDFEIAKGKKEKHFASYISQNANDVQIVVQNASFIDLVDTSRFTVAFLQDDLRKMGNPSFDQEKNLSHASLLVTNSIEAMASYPEYSFEMIPVGVDETLFRPMDKLLMRAKWGISTGAVVGIFVGALNEVKGWGRVKKCIEEDRSVHWIVVTKYNEEFSAPNVKLFSRIPQKDLAELLNCADFFMLGSEVETQCLAAIEAALCNTPIIMKSVGIFASMNASDKNKIGLFDLDFSSSIKMISSKLFSPRETILKFPLSKQSSMESWLELLSNIVLKIENQKFLNANNLNIAPRPQGFQNLAYRWEFFFRRKILRRFIGREYFLSIPEMSVYFRDHSPRFIYLLAKSTWKLLKSARS